MKVKLREENYSYGSPGYYCEITVRDESSKVLVSIKGPLTGYTWSLVTADYLPEVRAAWKDSTNRSELYYQFRMRSEDIEACTTAQEVYAILTNVALAN